MVESPVIKHSRIPLESRVQKVYLLTQTLEATKKKEIILTR